MAGVRILSPAPIDGSARLMERLMDLENRVGALERNPDLIVTPFNLTGGAGAISPQPTMSYTWRGGKLWIIAGGYVGFLAAGVNNVIGYQIKWTGGGAGSAFLATPTILGPSGPASPAALPSMVATAASPLPSPGTYTLTTTAYNANTNTYDAEGFIFEWAHP